MSSENDNCNEYLVKPLFNNRGEPSNARDLPRSPDRVEVRN